MIDKIGQQLIIGIQGKQLLDEEKDFIVKYNIGGVILFDRNLESPAQIHALVTELQTLRHQTRDKIPLFISIDMEGGRVQRLKEPFTKWPPVARLGDQASSTLAFRFALNMGEELRAFGINLDFAPCVDIFTNPKNTVIGDRSLSSNPDVVTQLSSALVRGYIKSNVVPCGKHFPGHGGTEIDSHFDLPISQDTLKSLDDSQALEPFKKIFKSRCEMVMSAHISFPKIDPNWPVTLSPVFLQQILRDVLRYRGLIITDDLDMKALAKHYPRDVIPVQALIAGANMLLYCNDFNSPMKALNSIAKALKDKKISNTLIDRNYSDILTFKKKNLIAPHDPFPLDKALEVLDRKDHKEFSQALSSGDVEKYLHAVSEE